jgi:CheY-like chemotaxis protein
MQQATSSVLLRAEIRSPKETVISYARVGKGTVFAVTDWTPPVGTRVEVHLSLPGEEELLDLHAHVVEHRAAGGPGDPSGIMLAFEIDTPEKEERVARLMTRLSSPPAPRRRMRVLLVEDNSFIRDMFAYGIAKYFRQDRELDFDHAEDAASAWEKIKREPYDLLIVDYYLPSEDGASFIARLRKDEKLAKTPVVAISVGGRDARDATLSAGADLFLDKPVVLRDLFSTLKLLSTTGAIA